jgi:hypothetical protein
MADTLRQSAGIEAVEPSISGVSWAAVSAGAAASLAITLVLLSFGAGMGFAVVSPGAAPGSRRPRSRSAPACSSS